MKKLAINDRTPVRSKFKLFPAQITIGIEEKVSVNRVMNSECLSRFRGNWIPEFWGGIEIQSLEQEWSKHFNCKYSIAVNSCTAALQIACGAIGLQPYDEVIVTPFSMTCSATAPMIWGATPIFADIEKDYFCLDPEAIEQKITSKTKAIIIVDLFGQSYDVEKIHNIAEKYNLFIIEDSAQAIGSKYKEYHTGTLGDIGCFSFTQGKHLTCGEGGMIVTDNKDLAMKCRLIRNHAEAVINGMPLSIQYKYSTNQNMIGFNMRMTEINAAIIREQLKKLDGFVEMRQENAEFFNKELSKIPAIRPAKIREDCTHSYYVQAFHFDNKLIHRNKFIEAVKAELTEEIGRIDKGVPIGCGYIQPLYLMPLFQTKNHWALEGRNYLKGLCPVTEKLWEDELFISMYHNLPLSQQDKNDIVEAFNKVWENKEEITHIPDRLKGSNYE